MFNKPGREEKWKKPDRKRRRQRRPSKHGGVRFGKATGKVRSKRRGQKKPMKHGGVQLADHSTDVRRRKRKKPRPMKHGGIRFGREEYVVKGKDVGYVGYKNMVPRGSFYRRPSYRDSGVGWKRVGKKISQLQWSNKEPKFRDNWDRSFNDRDFLVRDKDVFRDEKVMRRNKRRKRRY